MAACAVRVVGAGRTAGDASHCPPNAGSRHRAPVLGRGLAGGAKTAPAAAGARSNARHLCCASARTVRLLTSGASRSRRANPNHRDNPNQAPSRRGSPNPGRPNLDPNRGASRSRHSPSGTTRPFRSAWTRNAPPEKRPKASWRRPEPKSPRALRTLRLRQAHDSKSHDLTRQSP